MARNVIYFLGKNSQIPLAGIANLPYTDVILAFLYPDANGNLQLGGDAFNAPTQSLQGDVRTLQNAGKNVLISFGGVILTCPACPGALQLRALLGIAAAHRPLYPTRC